MLWRSSRVAASRRSSCVPRRTRIMVVLERSWVMRLADTCLPYKEWLRHAEKYQVEIADNSTTSPLNASRLFYLFACKRKHQSGMCSAAKRMASTAEIRSTGTVSVPSNTSP